MTHATRLLESTCRYGPEKSVIPLLLVKQDAGIVLTVCNRAASTMPDKNKTGRINPACFILCITSDR